MLTEQQILEKYGFTSAQLNKMEEEAAKGVLPGKPNGSIAVGRPLMFGEELKPVTFKEPTRKIEAIDARALSLGLSRSDYLRSLVEADLALA